MTVGKFEVDLDIASSIGHVIVWYLLMIVTIGLGVFVYPYALAKFILNKTYIVEDGKRVKKLQVDLDLASQIGHVVIWIILSIVTFGLAYFIFLYQIGKFVLNKTEVVDI